MAKPISNSHLHALLAEAGYSDAHAAFARQVNLHGRQAGLSLRYDAASVYWWLRGRRPEHPVPQLITDVLTRRLSRSIGVTEVGMGHNAKLPADSGLGLTFGTDVDEAVATVSELWRHHVLRRDFLAAAPFVAAATAEAGWRWHFDPRDPDATHDGTRQVTSRDVEALRACQQHFLNLDRRHGGGHSRWLLAQWLHTQVEPLLHGSYTDRVGRDLFGAVAELTGQVAFMSYDIGEHGLAQRHFIQALRLAKAADHTGFGAHILANMSTQAVYLQQPGEAVRLARAAVDGGKARTDATVMARLYTAEACAHAVAGDARSCAAALRLAEKATSRAHGADPPDWAGYFTPAHLAGTAMRCLRDLGRTKQALGHTEQALDLSHGSVRTRALHTALIASIHATGPAAEPERASQLGQDALDLAERVHSRRVSDRIADLSHRLVHFRGQPGVDAYLRRAAEHVSAA